MKTRTHVITFISIWMILLSSCDFLADQKPTITPDPSSISEQASTPELSMMNPYERTIWDFEQYRNEIKELSSTAAETPAGDLDPITRQMSLLTSRIKKYDFPLEAALAHSVLYNYAFMTTQCYMIKFDVFVNQMPEDDQDFFFGDFDRCERALVYEETFNQYFRTLKEDFASKSTDTTPVAQATQTSIDTPQMPTSTHPPTAIPEYLQTQTMEEYNAVIAPILSEWYEDIEILNEIRYQSIIEELPRLRDEFASLGYNPSFEIMHTRMIQYMDCQIASYLVLIGPEGIEAMNFDSDPAIYFENCIHNYE